MHSAIYESDWADRENYPLHTLQRSLLAGCGMKRILSVTGGGLRGCIPACALIELEKQIGKPTREIVDFVAGTSTGALIAAAVAAGLPATKILSIYQDRAGDIFKHGGLSLPLEVLRGYSDDSENIRRVLESEFPVQSVAWRMGDCPIKVLICATSMDGKTWYFVPKSPRNSGKTDAFYLIEAACASAAAPIYFSPFMVNGGTIPFYDGGVSGTANPSYQAAVEAFDYDTYDPAETKMVTLGTGYYPQPSTAPKGLLSEIEWVIDSLVDSSEDWVDKAVNRQWPGLNKKLNVELSRAIGMADISAIPEMVALGQLWASTLDWKAILEL